VIEDRVSAAAGRPVRSLRRVQTRGYALAFHAIADFADGSTAFVKAGAEEITSEFLRDELRFYRSVQAPFLPRLLGYDEADPPFLVLEDLSDSRWPPPWDESSIAAVRATLEAVWSTPPPDWLPPIVDERERLVGGWAEIEADPQPFLSLGLCTAEWLEHALPVLSHAAVTAEIEGETLIHLDVRSDNIALTDRGAVLVDWNFAHRGNSEFDLAAWLPSLHVEGGPPPDELLPAAGGYAAALAGFWGARAGLPPPPTAPQVREVQRAQLEVALGWAVRELELRWDE
jgi:hypothetical protein